MEFKKLMDFVKENKHEYLERELTVTCKECGGEGYFSEDGVNIEPCDNCCTEGTLSINDMQ
ncbi:hypothetical protein [Lysinibacillus sp. NPDC086135]|uniref:hypothetical protein n=1 Tax=Lysinibacillus sp. NPDC086135 TaxID=3364130 RepID=UPI003827960C